MRVARLVLGIVLGLAVVFVAWFADWVTPPESVARRVAAFAAVYPGPTGEAAVARMECPPLPRLRIYLVCTERCSGVRRVVVVKGLQAELLVNFNRAPPESLETTRHRINAAIGREGVRLDPDGAREMIGFYLRLEGLRPELLLPEGGAADVEAARAAGDDAMQRLAESLDAPGALARVRVETMAGGFGADMLYWDTWRAGRPVLRLRIRVGRDGQIHELSVMQPAPRQGTAGRDGGEQDGAGADGADRASAAGGAP